MAGKKDLIKDTNRYSILTKDLTHCKICGGTQDIHLHEVFYGTANRAKSKEDGLIIPLCAFHHNLSNQGIHHNKIFDLREKQRAQIVWQKHYKKSTEDFIKRFGQNYKEDD